MEVILDPENYLKQQEVFTGEMIARIADHLENAGVKGEQLKELTGNIAFEVACMIDDVSGMELDGDEAHPHLKAFQVSLITGLLCMLLFAGLTSI